MLRPLDLLRTMQEVRSESPSRGATVDVRREP